MILCTIFSRKVDLLNNRTFFLISTPLTSIPWIIPLIFFFLWTSAQRYASSLVLVVINTFTFPMLLRPVRPRLCIIRISLGIERINCHVTVKTSYISNSKTTYPFLQKERFQSLIVLIGLLTILLVPSRP